MMGITKFYKLWPKIYYHGYYVVMDISTVPCDYLMSYRLWEVLHCIYIYHCVHVCPWHLFPGARVSTGSTQKFLLTLLNRLLRTGQEGLCSAESLQLIPSSYGFIGRELILSHTGREGSSRTRQFLWNNLRRRHLRSASFRKGMSSSHWFYVLLSPQLGRCSEGY
jgi:hypothetical protein